VTLLGGNVLITGATGGLGQAIARGFAAKGAKLILTGRRVESLHAFAQEVGARVVRCDLADRGEVEALSRELQEAALDVFVANAGLPGSGQLTDFTLEEVDRALEVNLRSAVALTHAVLPGMIERGRGHLVYVSSLQGRAATPGAAVYVATKFALRGFALALRDDLRDRGVGVSVILPGFISAAGMFADAEVKLPPGVGTKPPDAVAAAVLRAVKHNRGEVDVAPVSLQLGARIASIAPQTAAMFQRLAGSHELAERVAQGQRDKR
jgi:short-subunit dehydrogenase